VTLCYVSVRPSVTSRSSTEMAKSLITQTTLHDNLRGDVWRIKERHFRCRLQLILRQVHVLWLLVCAGRGGRRRAFSRCCGKSTTRTSCSSARSVSVTFSLALENFCRSRSKGKDSLYSITERRVPELIPVLGSQPAKPAVGCHYFPPGLQLPPQPLRGLLPVLLLGEQGHNGCEQFA